MDPDLTARVALHDPGNAYSVNYLWGTDGVGYNVDMISKRMPDAPLDSWRMLYDPAVVSKFADCGVTVLDAPTEVVGTVLIYLGKDANSENPEDLKAAEDVLMKIRQYIRSVNSAKYIEDLANGEICLTPRLVRGRAAIAEPCQRGLQGHQHQLPDPEGRRRHVLRHARHPEGCRASAQCAFVHQLPDAARNRGEEFQFPQLRQQQCSFIPACEPRKCATIRVSIRRRRSRPSWCLNCAKSPEFTRLLTRSWTRFKTGK